MKLTVIYLADLSPLSHVIAHKRLSTSCVSFIQKVWDRKWFGSCAIPHVLEYLHLHHETSWGMDPVDHTLNLFGNIHCFLFHRFLVGIFYQPFDLLIHHWLDKFSLNGRSCVCHKACLYQTLFEIHHIHTVFLLGFLKTWVCRHGYRE